LHPGLHLSLIQWQPARRPWSIAFANESHDYMPRHHTYPWLWRWYTA
jgi:hypothetical protein